MELKRKLMISSLILATFLLISCGSKTEETKQEGTTTEAAKTETAGSEINSAKINEFLSAPVYGMTHFDPSQSDAFPYAVKTGDFNLDLKQFPQVTGGPVNIITLASTSENHMWGVSSQGVTYIDTSNGQFAELARKDAPGVRPISAEEHGKVLRREYTDIAQITEAVKENYKVDFTRMYNGIYSVVDNENKVYANFGANELDVFALVNKDDPKAGIEIVGTLDTSKFMGKDERLAGLSMTYDGKLIILGNRSVTVIDRDLKGEPQTVKFEDDEYTTNSVAVDENNGIYIASDKYMRKVVWTGSKLSSDEKDGAWRTEYEIGDQPPTVKFGKGTGSTPTLMGFGSDEDKLVVITDGANKMNIVAFWRDNIPEGFQQKPGTKSNRIADQFAITAGLPADTKWIQSEQSVVVRGYGAFVVNNIVNEAPEDRLTGVIALGPMIAPPVGAERVEWDTKEDKWKSVWTRGDVSSISMVPSVSIPSNIVFVNGYNKDSGWEVTGLDWNTGKTVHRSIFGKDNFGNGAYAIIQFLPNGDMLFNSIAGPIRISYSK